MTGRQTQFSRNLQGTAQDLQRIQQVISSLTDTIRGVSREFSSLLSGVNQATAQQGGQSPIPGLGMGAGQVGSSLLATAQQKLAEDVARYQREAEARQAMTQEQAKADQTLRILENNARRHGHSRPDLSLIQTTHPNIFQDAIAGRIGAQANPAEAIARAMQDRLREGMSVPEASLLLKKTFVS
jgi:ABC-type transporter Mla subunit MlaD